MRKQKFLIASLFLLAGISVGTSACSNNPFFPHAEIRILDVSSSEEGRFVGIRQSADVENGIPVTLYSYVEPVLKIENQVGLPPVNFERFTSEITLSDGTQLPIKDFPLSKGMVESQELEIQFPIMSVDRDIQNVVFPGNNAPRVSDGIARVTLHGTDLNGNSISVPFTVPLRFESVIYPDTNTPPIAAPSPSPSVASAPSSGGQ